MKRIALYKKDVKSRNFYNLYEIDKTLLKSLLSYFHSQHKSRYYLFDLMRRFRQKASLSFIRRSCVLSGYTKSVFQKFKLSRHSGKFLASNGYLIGYRKSSF